MRGTLFAQAIAATCVTSLATLTFATQQDPEVGQSGATRSAPPVHAVPADGGPLRSWTAESARHAPAATLDRPIVHRGIPGDQIVDGTYTRTSLTGQSTTREVSAGKTPMHPVDPDVAEGGFLSGCPCTFGTFENEPDCGFGNGLCDATSETVNGGCNMSIPAFSPLAVGETYCGTSYFNGACRDTDWFEFTLGAPTRVTWRATAEFNYQLLIIGDGTANCFGGSPPIVAFGFFAACTEGSISATLPAGTWWTWMGSDFSVTYACGAQYTATLERSCEVTLSEAAFDAANPGLTVEDFEDGNAPPAGFCGPHPTPWTSATVNSCLDAGDIEPGLSMDNQDGNPFGWLLGIGYNAGNPLDDQGFLGESTLQADMIFAPTATAVGLEIEHAFTGAGPATIEIYGPGLVLYDTITPTIADGASTFVGITCVEPIAQVRVLPDVLAPVVMGVRYGPRGGAGDCTVYTDAALFGTLYSDLTIETWNDANIGPGGATSCADPVDNAGDGGACFDPGDIEPGLVFQSTQAPSIDGVAIAGAGFGGNPHTSVIVGANYPSMRTEFLFPGSSVRQVGLRIVSFGVGSSTVDMKVYSSSGELMFSGLAPATDTGAFWGIACDRPIGRVSFDGSAGAFFELCDEVRFGTSKRNLGIRYCSPNLPNSTGNSGIMIVTGSDVDADDDLKLTAMQLPTNSNIGYFLMGTGTNTFIPTGAGSFLCVAPGLKRYLPPVNNTNQFPGGFDRVVGTQGNGHPISASITPGSTWNFQAWHRDSNAGTSHFTDAVSVTFQ